MQILTPQGQQLAQDLSQRYGVSQQAIQSMMQAVVQGGGTMAQFNIPELGGGGQWMQGGMIMVGDMFNQGLKNTVGNLCQEISQQMRNINFFEPLPQNQQQGGGNWWPSELGNPAASGSQNNMRYAYFPQTKRLALYYNGNVSVYDTLNHQISGVSQQQGNSQSVQFTSQYGIVDSLALPLLSGTGTMTSNHDMGFQPQQNDPAPQKMSQDNSGGNISSQEVFTAIEQLASLHEKGILNQQEFEHKKAELLGRL